MPLNEDLMRIMELAGTDPRFKALAEALSTPCWYATVRYTPGIGYTQEAVNQYHAAHISGDCPCHGLGRVLCTEWQQGALAGALLHWADVNIPYNPSLSSPQLHTLLVLCFREPDVDDKASEVFLKFMQRKKERHDGTSYGGRRGL